MSGWADLGENLGDISLFVNDIGVTTGASSGAQRAKSSGQFLFGIGQKGDLQAFLGNEFVLGCFVVGADAKNYRVQFGKLADYLGEGFAFNRSARGHRLGIKGENDILLAFEIAQFDGFFFASLGNGSQFKRGGFAAHLGNIC